MPNAENLWESVGNKCLKKAKSLLEWDTAPTAATIEAVQAPCRYRAGYRRS
jgi:hypothetical protein